MASNALTCSASPLVSNKVSFSSSPMAMALGQQSFASQGPKSSKQPTSRLSLVVRAKEQEFEGGISKEVARANPLPPLLHFHNHKRVSLLDPYPYMRTPWFSTEDENEIMMSLDVPGLGATDIEVNAVDSLIIIKGSEGLDAFEKKIYSPFNCKIQLPFNCEKQETKAILKNGVLYITVSKIIKVENRKLDPIPIKAI